MPQNRAKPCCPSIAGYETCAKSLNGWYIYAARYCVEGNPKAYPNFRAISMKKISDPGNYYLFACGFSASSNKPIFRMYADDDSSESYSRPYLIHNQKANLYFLDGHVEGRGRTRLSSVPRMNYACYKGVYIPLQ